MNPSEPNRSTLATNLLAEGVLDGEVKVSVSHEIVHLLSNQLYQSPLKAVEELVVNSYDAEATECRLYIPLSKFDEPEVIVVFDNGKGMDQVGLRDLWQIGRSNKRTDEIARRAHRKQIGKFGIGKLATYAIARHLTYLSKADGVVRGVSLDFDDLAPGSTGSSSEDVNLAVMRIDDLVDLVDDETIGLVAERAGIDLAALPSSDLSSWTLAILEDLKPKALAIHFGRLKWVLSTAMPLISDFALYLNGERRLCP